MSLGAGASDARDVTLCIASINTRRATELAIRSAVGLAGMPVKVHIGDCGSTDGTLEVLDRLRDSGLVDRVDIAHGRSHGAWVDHWVATVATPFLVIVDSDVAFLRQGWLVTMLEARGARDAALVTCEWTDADRYETPATGWTSTTMPRPAMHVLLIDRDRCADITTSFEYHLEIPADGPPRSWDTGARVAAALVEHGSVVDVMPESFRSAYVHFGALSWMGGRLDRQHRPRRAVDRARVFATRVRIDLTIRRRLRQWRAAGVAHDQVRARNRSS